MSAEFGNDDGGGFKALDIHLDGHFAGSESRPLSSVPYLFAVVEIEKLITAAVAVDVERFFGDIVLNVKRIADCRSAHAVCDETAEVIPVVHLAAVLGITGESSAVVIERDVGVLCKTSVRENPNGNFVVRIVCVGKHDRIRACAAVTEFFRPERRKPDNVIRRGQRSQIEFVFKRKRVAFVSCKQ